MVYTRSKRSKNGYWDAVNDPAHCDSSVAKIPDEYNGRTVGLKIRASYTITTNNIGAGGQCFSGSIASHTGTVVAAAGTTDCVWQTGSLHPDQPQLALQFDRYRTVSQGVEVSFIGKESDAAGEIILHTAQNSAASSTYVNNLNVMRDLQGTVTVPIPYLKTQPFVATASYDRPSFIAMNAGFLTSAAVFPTTFVGVVGAAISTQVLRIEVYTNIELIPKQDSLHEEMAAPAPPNQVHMDMVSRHLTSTRMHLAGHRALVAAGNAHIAKKSTSRKLSTRGPRAASQARARSRVRTRRRFTPGSISRRGKIPAYRGVTFGFSKSRGSRRKRTAMY